MVLAPVLAYQNIWVTLMRVVDRNVYLTAIVLPTKHVLETNVKIHAQELVVRMQYAKLLIIFHPAHVSLDILEIHSNSVTCYH